MNTKISRRLLARVPILLFDAFAVNVSYFIALMVRYYVHFEFKASAIKYIPMFRQFAPVYRESVPIC